MIGVGDAENDHAFLEICGLPVAVANAVPALKEKAALVTQHSAGAGVTELAGAVRPCVPKPPSTTPTTSAWGDFGDLPKLREIGFEANRRMLEVEKAAMTAESARRHSKCCKARLALRASAQRSALWRRARAGPLQCSCCSAFNSKASATGNCGHYLRRCSVWKKATSLRAA